MQHDYAAIVLGLGGIGSAATYWLSKRLGSDVLSLEQFPIGHGRGGSQDHSRIIRLSYHTPAYVELAKLAYQTWALVEKDADESLIIRTGGLDLSPADARISIIDYARSMTASNVPFETLDARETMRRWPQFRLADDTIALYQRESGIAPAARCSAAHLRLAREHGATLRDNTPITAIRPVGNEIEVVTADKIYRTGKLVIAAGAWSNPMLAHLGLRLPLTVTQEQVTYFATPHALDFMPDRFPIWIWMDDPCYYGFPIYGEAGPKVAQDVGGEEVTANTRTFDPNPAALQRVQDFLQRTIPGIVGPIIYTKTCLYTLTPDRDFVIDTLPEHPNIAVAIGAGHAFKFASLIGKTLIELVLDRQSVANVAPFRINRPILFAENPPKSFMT